MSSYQVTGPLALVTDQTGKVRYIYNGSPVPEDIDDEQLDRLIGRGLVSKVDEHERPVSDQAERAGSEPVERPAQVASKGLWVDYAVSRGAGRAAAEAMTKQELIDAYPGE